MGSVGGGSPEDQQATGTGGDGPPAVCVTGSTGYVGSWLVRTLLRRGYRVHATARDTGKAWWVLAAVEGGDRLRVFRADMGEDGSFDAAVAGCVALFHVAASMYLHVSPGHDNNVDECVRSNVLGPATRGTINVLQSCVRAGTVRRVVFTSAVSTLTAADADGRRKAVVDESCLRDLADVWRTKPVGWIYILSKRLAEEAAFKFALENGVHLVSVILPTVAGPFLTPSVPTSVQLLLSPITGDNHKHLVDKFVDLSRMAIFFLSENLILSCVAGDPKLYSLLASVHSRFGCVPLAHVQDACDAHVFLMESPRAEAGRYLCAAGGHRMAEVARLLASRYPPFKPTERLSRDFDASSAAAAAVSTKRLTDLGFRFEHGVADIVEDSVAQCLDYGFLEHPESDT